MSTSKLNVDGNLLLEQPFTRVPYENYRKVFRTSQRNVEKEFGPLQSTSNDLMNRAMTRTLSKEEAQNTIDGMVGRVESLKRKLSDLNETSGKPTIDVMRERLNHLAAIESMHSTTEPEFSRWADTRLDRWLVDWTLRTGKERTAKRIAREKDIERLVDIDLFSDIRRIEGALKKHSCTEALTWCSENKTALRKMKSTLEFELRLQEFIELARERRAVDAIAYAKKHLISWRETHLDEIKRASALFAFPPTTACGPYKRLYDISRWDNLVRSFRLAIYDLNTLPTEPLLHLSLYGGLAALKLPACYDLVTKNVDCPICDGESATLNTSSRMMIDSDSNNTEHSHSDSHPVTTTTTTTTTTTAIGGTTSLNSSTSTNTSTSSGDSTTSTSSSMGGNRAQSLGLGKLAEQIPFSHHANSTIVCRITGKIMDEDNMPMVFPNGYAYSLEAMQEMAAKNSGRVTCPRTNYECAFGELRKVFIS